MAVAYCDVSYALLLRQGAGNYVRQRLDHGVPLRQFQDAFGEELGLADAFNREHLSARAGDSDLAARVRSFERRAHRLKKAEVEDRRTSEFSAMPPDLHARLTLEQFADLVAFLESLKAPGK
jgi:hypothetical protein